MWPIVFGAVGTGLALFNTYASVKANKANARELRQKIETDNKLLARQYEAQKAAVAEQTRGICIYRIL